jgi:hypothetical protein
VDGNLKSADARSASDFDPSDNETAVGRTDNLRGLERRLIEAENFSRPFPAGEFGAASAEIRDKISF